MSRTRSKHGALAALLVLVAAVTAAEAQPKDYKAIPGYVDKQIFTDLADEDAVQIEIWLPGSLLGIIGGVDPELGELVEGLELAQALVLELGDAGLSERVRERVAETEKRLLREGWVRLAKIRDGDEHVSVLILTDGEVISGLTVMVVELGDTEPGLVFANVAGTLDLAKIQRLGEEMDLPGLEDLDVDEGKNREGE